MSHTKGPWIILDCGCISTTKGCIRQNCCAIYHTTVQGESKQRANASLIAASPDLLEALKELHALIPQTLSDLVDAKLAKAMWIIAKAEGLKL